ncbi:cleavage and polyadenylation specificity factor subunit 1 isoform X1 [Gossypium australe]|uniref:Cleavage and polyadenylation specificity factor subunit 1 isoform X1 n=1 Tax=Gossypium australe TaxID=47621 RepID=A0A5B6UQ56_9ROSI|nr:cleavage and polyadenylation specificity factor subunit 1 isoform X1 [Gossypium australe]
MILLWEQASCKAADIKAGEFAVFACAQLFNHVCDDNTRAHDMVHHVILQVLTDVSEVYGYGLWVHFSFKECPAKVEQCSFISYPSAT